jgi:hypothetical protein
MAITRTPMRASSRAPEGVEPVRPALAQHAFPGRDAGAAHRAVERAECLPGAGDRARDLRFFGHVRAKETRPASQLAGELLSLLLADIADCDVAPGRGEPARRRRPETRGAAGDKEGAAGNLHDSAVARVKGGSGGAGATGP